MIALKNVLVATDFSEASDAALTYGRTLASTFGATLHILHVTENVYPRAFGAETYVTTVPDLQREVDDAASRQLNELALDCDNSGPGTRKVLRTASAPARTIIEYAAEERIDLIVMGTHAGAVSPTCSWGASPNAWCARRRARCSPCGIRNTSSSSLTRWWRPRCVLRSGPCESRRPHPHRSTGTVGAAA